MSDVATGAVWSDLIAAIDDLTELGKDDIDDPFSPNDVDEMNGIEDWRGRYQYVSRECDDWKRLYGRMAESMKEKQARIESALRVARLFDPDRHDAHATVNSIIHAITDIRHGQG